MSRHLMPEGKPIEERFEDLISTTTSHRTPKLAILRTEIGLRVLYSAMRKIEYDLDREKSRRTLWRFHENNVLNYTDLNRNQFFIYGDQ